jgi:hypothetical protein
MKTLTLKEIKETVFSGVKTIRAYWQADNSIIVHISVLPEGHTYEIGGKYTGKVKNDRVLGHLFSPVFKVVQ